MSTQVELAYTWYPYGGYWAWGYPYQLNTEADDRAAVATATGVYTCYGDSTQYDFNVCRCDLATWELDVTVGQKDDVSQPPLHIVTDPSFSNGRRAPAVTAVFYSLPKTGWNTLREFNIELLSGWATELSSWDDSFGGEFGPSPDPPPDANEVTVLRLTLDQALADSMMSGAYRYSVRAKVVDYDTVEGVPIEDMPPTVVTLMYGTFTLKDC